jgi:nucleoid-associated protein YgaU
MRNNFKKTFINRTRQYKELFKKRKVKRPLQFATPVLKNVSDSDLKDLNLVPHIWKTGDRFFKLAAKFYGDAELWWVIAFFNYKPTDSHVTMGETIYVPLPLEKTLLLMDYQ